MDWLRRNWPDLLIGVALVAVIAGIIATLISGGSFFPIGPGNRNAGGATTTQNSGTTPGTTGNAITPTAPVGTAGQAEGTQAGTEAAGAGTEGAATTPDATPEAMPVSGTDTPATTQGATTPPATAGQGGAPIAVLPPGGQGASATATTPATAPSQATTAATQAPATQAPATQAPATTTSAGQSAQGAAPTNTAATAAAGESSYRVAVGAFGNPDNAQRLAGTFQAAGYPVLLGTQGNLTIVLVGPYDTEAQARSVADRVKAGNFGVTDATVYRYEPDASSTTTGQASTPTTTAPVAPTTPPPAATTPTPATTTAAAARYLQVGAYGSRESALPQIERLQGLGFQVTERTEGTLLKLLVGPYEGAALTEAKARLDSAGIESFAR